MLLCKNRRLFAVAGDNSRVLTPIPMHLIPIPTPRLILLPFPWNPMGPMRSHSPPLPCTRLVGAWKCAGETGAPPALHCTYSQRLQRLVVRVTRWRRLLISIISLRIQSHVICDNNTQQSAARTIRRVPDQPQRTTATSAYRRRPVQPPHSSQLITG